MSDALNDPAASAGLLAAQAAAEAEDNQELAQDIVDILRRERIHPVLTFGTGGSGKTMALVALMHYVRSTPSSGLALRQGKTIWPADRSTYKSVELVSRLFLDTDIETFASRRLIGRTLREVPYFVPVDIIHGDRVIRFAFFEGMGEWYEREARPIGISDAEDEPATRPFRSFKHILREVLETFEYGVSMIFVTPCVDAPAPSAQKKEYSHNCMAHAMREVEKRRIDRSRDNLLLLATKWDALNPPSDADALFSQVTAAELAKVVDPWSAWSEFVALRGFPKDAKAIMPHASAWVSNGTLLRDSQVEPVLDRFHRTLWNWLYGNALTAFQPGSEHPRPVLYPEVVPPRPQPMGLYERWTRLMTLDGWR